MSNHSSKTIAVIGAGFAGVMTAIQLARQSADQALRIILLEQGGQFGRGAAYGTRCPRHLLNVPAGNMSALPDVPDDFVQYLNYRGMPASATAFLPRSWYGDYLEAKLCSAIRDAGPAKIERRTERVTDLLSDEASVSLVLGNGRHLTIDGVVLAVGHFPPANIRTSNPAAFDSPRYVADPWKPTAMETIPATDDVCLIGTGLTSYDIVLELIHRGHRGIIHAISRHGLMPQAHRAPGWPRPFPPPPEVLNASRNSAALLRGLRQAIRRAVSLGYDWRDVLTSLRPHTTALWQRLNGREQARFLRHLRPFWETHRHRAPQEVDAMIHSLRERGALIIRAGRVLDLEADADGICVQYRPRGRSAPSQVRTSWVINCAGPNTDVAAHPHPLIGNLLRRGLILPDPLKLGILTTPEGAVINAAGVPSERVYLIGALRKAQLWECTAVPELRVHAAALARQVLADLRISRQN